MDTSGHNPEGCGRPAGRLPAAGDRVTVREHVPGWAGQSGTVKGVGPASAPRPVRVRPDDEDERDFAPDELEAEGAAARARRPGP